MALPAGCQAALRHGDPIVVDYTPSSGNVAAGQVIILGNTGSALSLVAQSPIVNNVQGAAEVADGVYEVTNLNNAANGAKVWWDGTNNKVTSVSTNNALFGYVVANGGRGANTTCLAFHTPWY